MSEKTNTVQVEPGVWLSSSNMLFMAGTYNQLNYALARMQFRYLRWN